MNDTVTMCMISVSHFVGSFLACFNHETLTDQNLIVWQILICTDSLFLSWFICVQISFPPMYQTIHLQYVYDALFIFFIGIASPDLLRQLLKFWTGWEVPALIS